MIDPRHLTHLLAIHEHGSLSLAGQALNLSQPALSNSIAILEQRLEHQSWSAMRGGQSSMNWALLWSGGRGKSGPCSIRPARKPCCCAADGSAPLRWG
ncbi:molybdenum-dependent DNA-binding transcriptional regulator ModE [Novosphingobium capsulatum]|uniref:Molybdenum-dependent DNA-binding transcriptional regulator ModE n=1 Tax=Novosphingobium capsulatum TaxID=13688 RepID=A0ABU1MML4_9SPHN|nr:molybdenum-dependent DNA-binding transcriptional regulator ModE [Novosphingobium capsulatum]